MNTEVTVFFFFFPKITHQTRSAGTCFKYKFKKIIWLRLVACGILVSQLGIKPLLAAVEAQSLNHWNAREVLEVNVLSPGGLLSPSPASVQQDHQPVPFVRGKERAKCSIRKGTRHDLFKGCYSMKHTTGLRKSHSLQTFWVCLQTFGRSSPKLNKEEIEKGGVVPSLEIQEK